MDTSAKIEDALENDDVFVDEVSTQEKETFPPTTGKWARDKISRLSPISKLSKSRPNSVSSFQSPKFKSLPSSPFRRLSFSTSFISTSSLSSNRDSMLSPTPSNNFGLTFLGQIYRSTLERLDNHRAQEHYEENREDGSKLD